MMPTSPQPVEIRLRRAEKLLEVDFDDGAHFSLPAEYLRVESPSAEVKGHGPGERRTVAGKRQVAVVGVEPVGNYAVRLLFDDGHDTGIYSWDYLYLLGRDRGGKWDAYLSALRAGKMSRDPK